MSVAKEKHGKSKTPQERYELPSPEALKEAGELTIQDEYGREVPFKQLYEGKGGQRLIIFIRNFFSSSCEEYIRTLSKELPPAFLSASTPPTVLTIIGCGDVSPIPHYRTRTMNDILGADTHFKIYSDPSRKLYTKLGMMHKQNLASFGQQSEPAKQTFVESVTSTIKSAVMGGTPAQTGGEMLFARGELVWFKRMRNTQDHAEVEELKQVLGLS